MPGVAYATPSLFVGCKAISTPEDGMSLVAVDYWESVWQEIGARIYRMTPAEHDDIFAQVSHLPHVLAYALVDAMARSEGAATKFSFVGAVFRDFTRIAASSPKMWRDICLANRDAILASLDMFEGGLAALREAIEKGDGDALQASFERACQARRTVSTRPAPSRAALAK